MRGGESQYHSACSGEGIYLSILLLALQDAGRGSSFPRQPDVQKTYPALVFLQLQLYTLYNKECPLCGLFWFFPWYRE